MESQQRAPAANIPLSAASRCASLPPSNPSVLPPEIGTQSEMTGFSCIWIAKNFLEQFATVLQVLFKGLSLRQSICDEFCHFDCDVFCLFDPVFPDLSSLSGGQNPIPKNFFA